MINLYGNYMGPKAFVKLSFIEFPYDALIENCETKPKLK